MSYMWHSTCAVMFKYKCIAKVPTPSNDCLQKHALCCSMCFLFKIRVIRSGLPGAAQAAATPRTAGATNGQTLKWPSNLGGAPAGDDIMAKVLTMVLMMRWTSIGLQPHTACTSVLPTRTHAREVTLVSGTTPQSLQHL